MRLSCRADHVEIIDDEDGFVLVVDTDSGDRLRINVHHLAAGFAANVDATIGAWLREAEDARETHPGQITVEDLDAYPEGDYKRIALEQEMNK